jgi:hypothetical protein
MLHSESFVYYNTGSSRGSSYRGSGTVALFCSTHQLKCTKQEAMLLAVGHHAASGECHKLDTCVQ